MIHLSVEELIERDLVSGLEMIEVEITHIEHSAQDVLDTGRFFVVVFRCVGGSCVLYECHILIGLVTALIYFSDEFIRLEGRCVDIGLIPVTDLEELVVERIGLSIGDHMINILAAEVIEVGGKSSFTCSHIHAGQRIVYLIGEHFSCLKSCIAYRTCIVSLARCLREAYSRQQYDTDRKKCSHLFLNNLMLNISRLPISAGTIRFTSHIANDAANIPIVLVLNISSTCILVVHLNPSSVRKVKVS